MPKFISNLFVPNPTNNHKAGLLHNFGLASLILLVFGFNLGLLIIQKNPSEVLGTNANITAEEIIRYTNLARLAEQLPALNHDPQLSQAAEAKAKDMLAFGYWDHYSPAKRTPWTFVLDAGYSYEVAGENLARDFSSPEKLISAWMESPAHRANIVNDKYQDIGVAVVPGTLNDKPVILVVQLFGKKLPPEVAQAVSQLDPQQVAAAGMVEYNPQTTLLNSTLQNRYLSTRAIAGITVTMLILVIAFDTFLVHRYHNVPRVSAKFWGHMLFLYTIGILSFIT